MAEKKAEPALVGLEDGGVLRRGDIGAFSVGERLLTAELVLGCGIHGVCAGKDASGHLGKREETLVHTIADQIVGACGQVPHNGLNVLDGDPDLGLGVDIRRCLHIGVIRTGLP